MIELYSDYLGTMSYFWDPTTRQMYRKDNMRKDNYMTILSPSHEEYQHIMEINLARNNGCIIC